MRIGTTMWTTSASSASYHLITLLSPVSSLLTDGIIALPVSSSVGWSSDFRKSHTGAGTGRCIDVISIHKVHSKKERYWINNSNEAIEDRLNYATRRRRKPKRRRWKICHLGGVGKGMSLLTLSNSSGVSGDHKLIYS